MITPAVSQTDRRPLHVVNRYGRTSAGDRVRVYEWLEHTGISAHNFTFDVTPARFGTAAIYGAPVQTFVRHRAGHRHVQSVTKQDRVLLYREMSPVSRGQLEEKLIQRAGFTTFDLDDANFNDHDGGFIRSKVFSKAAKANFLARKSQRVIAGNQYIADWASTHCSDVRVIPSCVEPTKYFRKSQFEFNEHPRLVWIGSSSTEQFLTPLSDVLVQLHKEYGLTLTIISGEAPIDPRLQKVVKRVRWSEKTAYETLMEHDIGLMPLPDNPYERGKCGYKLLQYGAAGLPVLGSPVGVNREILTQFGADAPVVASDWYDCLKNLINASVAVRATLGANAHKVVSDRYSFETWSENWIGSVFE
jgi:glycosyltransferase involved in cell wall biosynthesis